MRKYTWIFLILLLVTSLFMWFKHKDDKHDLNICLYANWIDKDIIEQFEKETNLRVNINYCSDYDELEAKLLSGAHSYDLVLMSAWPYIEKGDKINLYREIDTSKTERFNEINNKIIIKAFEGLKITAIPFLWGSIAIAYSKKAAKKRGLIKSDFSSPMFFLNKEKIEKIKKEGKVIIIDSATEFVDLFQEMSPSDVIKKIPSESLNFDTNYIKMLLKSGEAVCAIGLSDDLISAQKDNDDIEVVLFDKGIIWLDLMMIPNKYGKDKKKPFNLTEDKEKNIYNLINFLMRKDIYEKIMNKNSSFSVFDNSKEKNNIIENSSYDRDRDDLDLIYLMWSELKMKVNKNRKN